MYEGVGVARIAQNGANFVSAGFLGEGSGADMGLAQNRF